MSASSSSAPRAGSPSKRLVRAWRGLPQERRLAAGAALGLFASLFLPWYQETIIASGVTNLERVSTSVTGWGAFSFVEAAVLLVAAAVLALLFVRAEGRAFHVPGGDGGVITVAGLWTCVLVVWRIFDKQGSSSHGTVATISGIEWGIFIALGIAAVLAYAGTRIRLAHEPEPPLPGEPARPAGAETAPRRPEMDVDDSWTPPPRRGARRRPRQDEEDDTRVLSAGAEEAPTRRIRPRSVSEGQPATGLDPKEIQELDLAEPPTARLGRPHAAGGDQPAHPSTEDQPPEAGDQLTIRLDRPD